MNTASHKHPEFNAEIVAQYVVSQCSLRYGTAWLGSRSEQYSVECTDNAVWLESQSVAFNDRLRERLVGIRDWRALIRNFQLKGVREDSRQGLLGWLDGAYALHLLDYPPTPEDMLIFQCRGERVVTLNRADSGPIGRHAGPFEFLLHDLEHAHKFFGCGTFQGQVRFFNLLREALEAGHFNVWRSQPRFRTDLEYLMSDMNSHPLHLLKYLKAIVLEAVPAKSIAELDRWCDDLFDLWRLPEPVLTAARKINYPALENNEARLRVSDFFAFS